MSILPRAVLRELVAPLSIAAYIAWGAVWFAVVPDLRRDAGSAASLLAVACLLGFLGCFVTAIALGTRLTRRGFAAIASGMTLTALTLIALGPTGASPILLVLLSGMLAARLDTRALTLALVGINLTFAALLLWVWQSSVQYVLVSLAAYASFELFSALLMRYANRAEQMNETLRALNADLLATRSLLEESARDSERLRLSRELHDVAGHALTALKLNLGVLTRDARQPDPDRVALCAQLADELLQNLRGVVQQMRLHEGMDLRLAIERLTAPFPRPVVHLTIADDARVDSLERAEALLRAVQEGVTNAARHSGAEHVWIALDNRDGRVVLDIRDDGRASRPVVCGNGLDGMRERLQAAGGGLTIAHEDHGVQLNAWVPAMRTE